MGLTRIRLSAVVGLAAVVGLVGCAHCPDPYVKDYEAVVGCLRPSVPGGVMILCAGSYQEGTAVTCTFSVGGPLQEWTGVPEPGEAAFWVKDGKVYAVNDAAREVAPDLEQAPDSIKYDQAFVDAAHAGE